MGMSKKKTKSQEELLKEALVPVEEQPYEVPVNWSWVRLSAVFEQVTKQVQPSGVEKYIGLEHLLKGGGYLGSGLSDELKSKKVAFKVGDVLYGKLRPYLNKHAIVDFDGVASTDILIYRSPNVNLAKLLNLYLGLPHVIGYANENSNGINLPRVSPRAMANLSFPLPPLNEQKRIADKVERLLGKINQAKQLIEEAKETFELRRAAILDKAFRGELTKKWRDDQEYLKPGNIYLEEINELKLKRYKLDCDEALELGEKKPQKIKSISVVNSTEDFELPDNWITCSLGDIVYDFRYGTSSKSDYNYEGVPVLRIPNIGNEHITVEDIKYLRENQVERSNTVSEGDLLIIRSNGSKDLVGKCALVNKNCEGYAFASYLIRLRPIGVFPEYVYYLLRSENVRKQFFNKAKSSAGINNINTVELSATNIPLPSYEEQIQIVEVIKHLFSIEDEVLNRINTKDLLSSLSESVLSKAFRGELGTSNIEEENPEFLL